MQSMIEQLKNQNAKLREELKSEKTDNQKNKKKPLEELEKLKQISNPNSKLEKEIQLL